MDVGINIIHFSKIIRAAIHPLCLWSKFTGRPPTSVWYLTCRSQLTCSAICLDHVPTVIKLVSFAYILGTENWRRFGKSFIYNRNKRGPKIDPLSTFEIWHLHLLWIRVEWCFESVEVFSTPHIDKRVFLYNWTWFLIFNYFDCSQQSLFLTYYVSSFYPTLILSLVTVCVYFYLAFLAPDEG